MNRRNFLASLAAVAVLDPDKLLWVPGQKKIFIPSPEIVKPWGPIIGINLEATRAGGQFHNGLRGYGDTISVVQYSELDNVCREAFNGWLRSWGYSIPTKENCFSIDAGPRAVLGPVAGLPESGPFRRDPAAAGKGNEFAIICGTWPIVQR